MKFIPLLFLLFLLHPLAVDAAPTATQLFEKELKKRRISFLPPDKDGVYRIKSGAIELAVSLDNIARNNPRDPVAMRRFVDQIMSAVSFPPWDKAKALVYFFAEPARADFGETIRDKISATLNRVLVLTDKKESKVIWVTPQMIDDWKIPIAEAKFVAAQNLDRLLDGKKLEVQEINGMKLGMVPLDSVFKASVIFAPNFKKFVSSELSWPVLAVIPSRDFIYLLSEKDMALLDRLEGIVRREFRESGYRITTEVFRLSDGGVSAIGEFPR